MAEPGTTPILYLDVDDEITSAAARIRRVEGDRLALVVPFGSRLATSRINFRLLAREATERGKTIEIVTADASARALAGSAGLVVHPSVAAFETGVVTAEPSPPVGGAPTNGSEPGADDDTATRVLAVPAGGPAAAAARRGLEKPRDRTAVPLVGPTRPPVRTSVAAGVGLALVALFAVGAWVAIAVLPSATITIAPRAEAIGPLALTVEARADVATPDVDALLIPAHEFTFDLAVDQTFQATGVKVTETKATGSVTFSNFDTGRGVAIPAGTIVRTENKVEFATLADVTLPRAQIDFFPPFPTHPSTGSVGIEAVVAGESGNVGNNTVVEIPGGGRNLFVTNEERTSGGSRTESPQISQADVDAALEALETALDAELEIVLQAPPGVPAGTRLFAGTAIVGESTPSADPSAIVGTDAAEFELGLAAVGTVLGVNPAPLEQVAAQRLQARIPEGWRLADGSLSVAVGEPTVFGRTVTFPLSVRGTQVRVVDPGVALAEVRGLLLAEARNRLAVYGDVEITLWPDWVTNVPTDPSKVTMTILEPRAAAP